MRIQLQNYLTQGFKLFPVAHGGKVPLTPNGVHDATDNPQIIDIIEGNGTNVGIATGPTSGVVVLDIDGEKGLKSLEMLEKEFGELPKEAIVRTPSGGLHYYFKAPQMELGNRAGIFPGIDFRAKGGYVVAPPSIGQNDKGYAWEKPLKELREPPAWVIVMVQGLTHRETSCLDPDGMVVEGHRNDYLFRMACRLRRSGLSQSAIMDAISAENEERCIPPLGDREIAVIERSTRKYEATDPILPEDGPTTPDKLILRAKDLNKSMCTYLRDKDKVQGQTTFMKGLDKLLGGGLRTGELNVWHAHAKTGKNTLWHKLLFLQMLNLIPNGYASRELTPETEVMPNLYSIAFGENIWLSQNIDEERFDKISQDWPLYFCRGYGYLPLYDLVAWIKALKGRGVDIFWFDHLHYMLEDPEDHKAASKLIKELKALTKTEDICVNLIVQPNKMMDGQGLSLNSLKGGSAIGQALDNLILLERHQSYDNVMRVSLEVARSKLCKLGHFHLQYDSETTDMAEVEIKDMPEQQPQSPMGQYMQTKFVQS